MWHLDLWSIRFLGIRAQLTKGGPYTCRVKADAFDIVPAKLAGCPKHDSIIPKISSALANHDDGLTHLVRWVWPLFLRIHASFSRYYPDQQFVVCLLHHA